MSLSEAWRAHLRLSVLRVLSETPGYSANESLLTDVIRDAGFGATRDQVRGEIDWLCEQGLVTCTVLADLKIAAITGRGEDVARGRASVTGVKRPSPRG